MCLRLVGELREPGRVGVRVHDAAHREPARALDREAAVSSSIPSQKSGIEYVAIVNVVTE